MVYVPRDEALVDVLMELPIEQQQQLRNTERKLIDYLDGCVSSEGGPGSSDR
jgi:hypothetical protein